MTAAYRNRNRPRVNSETQSSSVETQSFAVNDEFTTTSPWAVTVAAHPNSSPAPESL